METRIKDGGLQSVHNQIVNIWDFVGQTQGLLSSLLNSAFKNQHRQYANEARGCVPIKLYLHKQVASGRGSRAALGQPCTN